MMGKGGTLRLLEFAFVLSGVVLEGFCKDIHLVQYENRHRDGPFNMYKDTNIVSNEISTHHHNDKNAFGPIQQESAPNIFDSMAMLLGQYPWHVKQDIPLDGQKQAIIDSKEKCSAFDVTSDFLTEEQRKQGGIILHVIIGVYICVALGILCDYYFVPSLEIICYHLKIQEDVGGATLMGIGSSAPDIFCGIIAILLDEGELGVGLLMGTTVFNLLLVVGVMGMIVCRNTCTLMWWPLSRDMAVYGLSVVAMAIVVLDGTVSAIESSLLVVLYIIYFIILWFNEPIEKRVYWLIKDEVSMELRFEDAAMKKSLLGVDNTEDKNAEIDGKSSELSSESSDQDYCGYPTEPPEYPFQIPNQPKEAIVWFLLFPIKFIFFLTVPDLRRPKCQKLVSVTFIVSIAWTGFLTYTLLRMVNTFGATFGIPGEIMGITLVTFGTSVPDLLCSVIVIKRGRADMAMSQCIAANPFGILIGVGLPWFLKITVIKHGVLYVPRSDMLISCFKTFSLIVLAYIFLFLRKFRLDRKVGVVFLIGYILYIAAAVCYAIYVTCGIR